MRLYFASQTEREAVAWFKRTHGHRWRQRALTETAYDPHWTKIDWRRGIITFVHHDRRQVLGWSLRPYGHPNMNQMHMRALRCIRRNTYFPQIAKRLSQAA